MLDRTQKDIIVDLIREELRVIESLITNEDDFVVEPELSEIKEQKEKLRNILDVL